MGFTRGNLQAAMKRWLSIIVTATLAVILLAGAAASGAGPATSADPGESTPVEAGHAETSSDGSEIDDDLLDPQPDVASGTRVFTAGYPSPAIPAPERPTARIERPPKR